MVSLRVTGTTFTTIKSGLPPQANGLSFYNTVTNQKIIKLTFSFIISFGGAIECFIKANQTRQLQVHQLLGRLDLNLVGL